MHPPAAARPLSLKAAVLADGPPVPSDGSASFRALLAAELDRDEEEVARALREAGESEAKRRQLELLASVEEASASGGLSAEEAADIRARIEAAPAIPTRHSLLG